MISTLFGEAIYIRLPNDIHNNLQLCMHSRNQTGHPIVTVDQIRLNFRDDMIDDFPLKSNGNLGIFPFKICMEAVGVKKYPVPG